MASHSTSTSAPPLRESALELDLPRFRKRAGISLDQIVDRTKISLRFLQAIEDERFEQLPGGIFSTSYLRQYAASIGYDEDALVTHCLRKLNPPIAIAKGPQRETKARLLDWLRTAAAPTSR